MGEIEPDQPTPEFEKCRSQDAAPQGPPPLQAARRHESEHQSEDGREPGGPYRKGTTNLRVITHRCSCVPETSDGV
jgi:hypothetical protein